MKKSQALAGALTVSAVLALLTGCGAAGTTASAGPVTIDYMGWVPKADKAVDIWNKAHPETQVKYSPVSNGQDAYPKIRSSVQAGNAGCLAQLTLDQVPSFVADGMLMDVTQYTGDVKDTFLDWTWSQVSPGGQTYAIPQDTGPMAMYYRTDLFEKFGITVPKTWDEFATAAKTVHAADPSVSLGYLATDDSSTVAAYAWQRDSSWFAIDGDSWKVGIDDSASAASATYWQDLLDSGAIATTKRWDPGFYSELASGKYLTMMGGAWNTALIEANVGDTAGKWALAPMPTVKGSTASANSGGSAVAVLKGCKYPEQAVAFATWLNSSEDSLNILSAADGGGLYPAATKALDYAVVNQKDSFFGGQNLNDIFRESANNVNVGWAWGPTYSSTDTTLTDGLAKVATKGTTLPALMTSLQTSTLSDMKGRGIQAAASH